MTLPKIGDFYVPDDEITPRLVFMVLPIDGGHRILFEDAGAPVDIIDEPPPPPDPASVLADARAIALMQIDQIQTAKFEAGADTPSGRVKTDTASRELIHSMFSFAMASIIAHLSFSQEFTLANGTVVTLDAQAAMGVGLATVGRYNTLRDYSRLLIAQVENAATPDDLAAIDLTAGWPA